MKLAQDTRFRQERKAYDFRFTCEHCVHFRVKIQRCAHDYPPEAHRTLAYEDPEQPLVFCKEFEAA